MSDWYDEDTLRDERDEMRADVAALKAENTRLRDALRLKESAVESTYRAYVALQEKVERSSLLTLAATQAADVAALAAGNELLWSILGKANPVTFNGLTIEEQQYLDKARAEALRVLH